MIDVDVISQLVPNPATALVTLCSVLVIFFFAKKFLWKSIKNWMDARADKMQEDLSVSENAKKEALEDRSKAALEISQAAQKSRDIVESAIKEANSEKKTILENAKSEAEAEKKKAKADIEAERKAMYDSVKDEMVNVALDAAGKLIGSKNVDELDRKAIRDFVKESSHHEE